MVVWLTHKLRSTFEIEPSEPHFILRNLLLTRNIVSSPRAHPCGRNSLSPPPQAINFFLPPPPHYTGGGGGVILYYFSPLLNIGYAQHVDQIILNQ